MMLNMKYVFMVLFVLSSMQPVQAAPCDMHDGQNGAMSDHSMPMGSMPMGSMHGDAEQAMDCCDHDPVDPGDGCDSTSHCGACPAGVVAVDSSISVFTHSSSLQICQAGTEPLNIFSSPPFRPPIS
jgi:hypothetical protein